MTALTKITKVETKLYLREPISVLLVLGLPLALLIVFGSIGTGEESADDGISAGFLPSMTLALSVAMLGLSVLPTVLATYREKGILRRMRTTPVHPSNLLNAQLLVNIGVAAAAAVLVLGVGAAFFDLGWPENGLAFLLSYVLMTAALLSIGLVIAAVAKTTTFATGAGLLLFFPSMFFAGVWTPGDLMPEWARPVRAVSPMGAGMESIQAAWAGGWPDPLNVLALVVVTVIAGVVAARLFRWE